MRAFYWRLVKRTPAILWRSLTDLDKYLGALTLMVAAVGFSAWQRWLPGWAPFAAFGVIVLYGFLKENYETYKAVEDDRATLREGAETKAKRAAIGSGLQQLYGQGAELRVEFINSTDETTVDQCQEELVAWRQSVLDYLVENVSLGKAQYVDGVTSVNSATISGMKSNTTRREKETIVLHLQARLARLAEVMRDY